MTRDEVIALAVEHGIPADDLTYDGLGRLEGHADRELAAAVSWLCETGYADRESGDVDAPTGFFWRLDRWIVVTDGQGFVSVVERDDEKQAIQAFIAVEDAYEEWVAASEVEL